MYNFSHNSKFGPSILTFEFPNIKLADSSNKDYNKGWISYTISPKAGLQVGEDILNTAYIYFDNNPAIVTNTTLNEYDPTSIFTPESDMHITLYPNPVQDVLYIDNNRDDAQSAEIYSVLGQLISRHSLSSGRNTIATSQLAHGIYFVKCIGKDGISVTYKIVK